MITRLEIALRPEIRDPRGESVQRQAKLYLGIDLAEVRTCDVYHIEGSLEPGESRRLLHEFVDPVSQQGAAGRLELGSWDVVVSVGFKPGVTDPVAKSARVAIEDTLGRRLRDDDAVYSSCLYLLRGTDVEVGERLARELLANAVIQEIRVARHATWAAEPVDLVVPRVRTRHTPEVEAIDLSGDDDALRRISRDRLLALALPEMRAIAEHFARAAEDRERRAAGLSAAPTDVELECLAQTWSEHCKHKIFNARIDYVEGDGAPQRIDSLFKTYVRGATEAVDRVVREREGASWLVSVFHDNAGAVTFDERVHLVFKVETHNSPSALDPYGGAITGIVGVNRDAFGTGLGAELLVNVWGYCFAPPAHEGPLPQGLLHPRRVRDGVHQGVIDGGNQSGIPYGRGWELFDTRFLGKPLVFCGTVGALPVRIAGAPGEVKAARPGDRIVMVGGRIGADGIHGATFSSAHLDDSAPVQAVQIGDPITQKRMFDFLLEARDRGWYSSITDNGAGGLSSSVGEMAQRPGGARIDLARAPLKYEGLAPWEILVSEAQERMTLAVPPRHVEALLDLARRREVEATVLGEFTADGYLRVLHGDRTVGLLSMAFLHDGAPPLELRAAWSPPRLPEPSSTEVTDLGQALCELLRRPNLASGEGKARHYDHEVKGLTVIKPWIGAASDVQAEATVFLARHGSRRGFVLSEGVLPFYSDIDAGAMAAAGVDLAVRRQLCAGARLDRIALLDNFCWPDPVASPETPDGAYKLAQLVRACRALHDVVVAYGAPLISGKDSMKNDSVKGGIKISVPPTLLVSALGQMDDIAAAVTLDFKRPGDVILLLGATRDELGGSEFYRWLGERDGQSAPLGQARPWIGSAVPRLEVQETLPLYRAVEAAQSAGLLRSAATPALGGLGVTLARSAMAGRLGFDVELGAAADLAALPVERALFSESLGRFVVTVAPQHVERVVEHFAGMSCFRLGSVAETSRCVVRQGGRVAIDVAIEAFVAAFHGGLTDV